MTNWPRQSAAAMNEFFGNPDRNNDGAPDAEWEAENLTYIIPPYPMFYGGNKVTRIRCHKKVADSLTRVLTRIGEEIPEETIKRCGLDQFGGVYNFRPKRGTSSSLSTHAYAAAIDLAVALNPWKVKYGSRPNMMPLEVVRIFQEEGWDWGGLWTNGDAMHFQAAKTGAGQDLTVIQKAPKGVPVNGFSPLVEQIQVALAAKGYNMVGVIDGKYGRNTRDAINAFQADNGLALTGLPSAELWEQISAAPARPVAEERAVGKPVENEAKKANKVNVTLGTVLAGGSVVSMAEPILTQVEGGLGLVARLRSALDPILDLWPILAIAVGLGIVWFALQSNKAVDQDFQTGKLSR